MIEEDYIGRRKEKLTLEYMGTKEAAEKWGYTQATISSWCRQGIIDNAEQDSKGSPWRIPANAEYPKNKPKRGKNND